MYFSLLTLAFTALTYYIVFRWTSVTGGENGLSGVRRLALFGLDLDDQRLFYYFCALIVFVTVWLVWRVVHAPLGTVLMAIRENEQRARFAGYPVLRYKLAAFIISASVVGLGGSLFAMLKLFVSAELVHVSFSGELLAMTVVGGMGSFLGPALGAAFYLLFREVVTSFTTSWQFWFGLLFMATILFSPLGLVGLGERVLAPMRRHQCGAAAMAARVTPQPHQEAPAFLRTHAKVEGPLLVCKDVAKHFGGFTAVDGVDIAIEDRTLARPDRPQRRGQDHAVQSDLGHVRCRIKARSCWPANPSAAWRPKTSWRRGSRARSRSPACSRPSASGSICVWPCRRARPAVSIFCVPLPRSTR